jgi:thioredoxin-dependent adenylylsulfate APS reductase
MHITMVKKLLAGGRACDKCIKAEETLRTRGLWERIDEVVWAVEVDPSSAGMVLAAQKGITLAPFFIVRDDAGAETIHTGVLKFIKECLQVTERSNSSHVPDLGALGASDSSFPQVQRTASDLVGEGELHECFEQLRGCSPQQVMNWALERYGQDCALSFSGAEDVMLIDLAKKSGRPFSVFSLDTGRLHPETYEFIERVRVHYGITIDLLWPDFVSVQELVRDKGLFSFYQDGHEECCAIRKVEPLGRALHRYRAWVTGQRRDQSPTRKNLELLQLDRGRPGLAGPLLKLNPLAALSLVDVWNYLREQGVPYNPLHDRGFVSIGCAPCTRAIRPGEHERAGRWWWEDATKRECGLHMAPPRV